MTRKRPLVSLTPLIDVVFILLVFFLLASSFPDWRSIDVTPPARAAAGGPVLEGALLVEIRQRDLRLAAESMTLDDLAGRVRKRLATQAGQRVLVKPAPGVPLQRTVEVMDRLQAAGVRNLTLTAR